MNEEKRTVIDFEQLRVEQHKRVKDRVQSKRFEVFINGLPVRCNELLIKVEQGAEPIANVEFYVDGHVHPTRSAETHG
jgi:hypothetical protein